mgnify:CR=1 FL=1
MEQGKATIKSVKKELRLLQKAEEDAASNESARYPLHPSAAPTPMIPKALPTGRTLTLSSHPAGTVAAMVDKLNEAHDEALGEIEEREKQFDARFDGDDETLSSPGL